MHCTFSLFSSTSTISLAAVGFILQLSASCTTHWAHFSARTDMGKPKETGRYGLWTLCSLKGPRWRDDCDPLDTFFEAPPYARVAGGLAIVHLVLMSLVIAIETMRTVRVVQGIQNYHKTTRWFSMAQVNIAFVCVIFSILVAVLASVYENRQLEYTVVKGFSFWLQVAVIIVDFVVMVLCGFSNFCYWKQYIKSTADPMGTRSETYGNPVFTSDSPLDRRKRLQDFSDSRADEQPKPQVVLDVQSLLPISYHEPSMPNSKFIKSTEKNSSGSAKNGSKKQRRRNSNSACESLAYENPSFHEISANSEEQSMS